MYQRLLVPLDGSPLAEQVLPYVYVLGNSLKCPIALVRAFDLPYMLESADGATIDRVSTGLRQQAQEYLNRLSTSLRDAGETVSVAEYEGDPATVIVNEAEKVPDTLIAISTHGRSGVTRWVLGSVAEKVLNATTNPLLMIRGKPVEGSSPPDLPAPSQEWAALVDVKTIVVPLDGSPVSEQVLPHAVALAKSLDASVVPVGVSTSANDDAQVSEYLNNAVQQLGQEGVISEGGQLLHGDPAGAILDMTQRTTGCLVAMTTRGRSGVQRWVMGSVTDRVVRHSGTPVLVVRAT